MEHFGGLNIEAKTLWVVIAPIINGAPGQAFYTPVDKFVVNASLVSLCFSKTIKTIFYAMSLPSIALALLL